MEGDGYTLDDKRNDSKINDIPDIIARFENKSKETTADRAKKHFSVPVAEIQANDWDLSINKYRQEKHEETVHRPSKVIIAEAKKEVTALLAGFDELDKVLTKENKESS